MTTIRERDARFAEIVDRIADAFERAMRTEPARPPVPTPHAQPQPHRVPLATRRRRLVPIEW